MDNVSEYDWCGAALADLLHTGGRGMVVFAIDGPDGWQQHAAPARLAVKETVRLEGETDRYMSVAQFQRGRRDSGKVMSFGGLAIDVDNPALDPEALAAELLAYLPKLGIPEPSVIVATGMKGIHLYWALSRRIPGQVAPRWHTTVSALADKLKRFGADPACVDTARVLRLPGTLHGKSGAECRIIHWTGERVDFEELFCAAVPFRRAELERRRDAGQNARERKRTPARGSKHTPYPSRVLDALERLAHSRGGFRPNRERNQAVTIAAAILATFLTGEELTAAVLAFGHRTTDLSDSELRTCARSAMRKRQADGTGYQYRKATIVRMLEITPEERAAVGLATMPDGQRRERERDRKRTELR